MIALRFVQDWATMPGLILQFTEACCQYGNKQRTASCPFGARLNNEMVTVEAQFAVKGYLLYGCIYRNGGQGNPGVSIEENYLENGVNLSGLAGVLA
jgi:hypothetical protein